MPVHWDSVAGKGGGGGGSMQSMVSPLFHCVSKGRDAFFPTSEDFLLFEKNVIYQKSYRSLSNPLFFSDTLLLKVSVT